MAIQAADLPGVRAGIGVDLDAGARTPPMPPRRTTQSAGGVPISSPKPPAAPTTPGAPAAPAEPQMDATALPDIAACLEQRNQSVRLIGGRSAPVSSRNRSRGRFDGAWWRNCEHDAYAGSGMVEVVVGTVATLEGLPATSASCGQRSRAVPCGCRHFGRWRS